jgi:hypothetical protein
MTPGSRSDGSIEPPASPEGDELDIAGAGSSVHGGRPTFGLVRREGPEGASLTLHELLPDEQAEARRDRLERAASHRRLVTASFEDVFGESGAASVARWEWDDWTAVKIATLSGARLRAITSLLREVPDVPKLESLAGGDGPSVAFVPEGTGVRLALAFAGIKPIQRVDRMRAFCRGIARMGEDECYYWHAKCRSPSSPNGEKALRTLLTDHI